MYELTLTHNDRMAIDWIGNRYSNGDDLKILLCECSYKSYHSTSNAWESKSDITFLIPEYIAWQITNNASEEDGDSEYTFPCFAQDLAEKMVEFCYNII